jgi:[acyl-carrier-protein] S-malonyltransferase
MKKAYVFPGQGAQFEGMGKDLYEQHDLAKELMEHANEVLGYRLTDVMFEGSAEDLVQTKITQPAIFLHSIVKARLAGDQFLPDAVAGHSLGEFSALVACGALDFSDALRLVQQRALAMQRACEAQPGTMAAILGMEDAQVESICAEIEDVVVPANYNSPGQLVISGSITGVQIAVQKLTEAGAKKAVLLQVGGAFHSPLMAPARDELAAAIATTPFQAPRCPIYQNVDAVAETNPERIKDKLIEQLTAPVKWTQIMQQMLADGVTHVYETGGNGKVLRGLFAKVDRSLPTEAL